MDSGEKIVVTAATVATLSDSGRDDSGDRSAVIGQRRFSRTETARPENGDSGQQW